MPAGWDKKAVWNSEGHVERWVDDAGQQRVRGLPSLKLSEAYPWGFADKIFKLWMDSKPNAVVRGFEHIADADETSWDDAQLGGVDAFLRSSKEASRCAKARLAL